MEHKMTESIKQNIKQKMDYINSQMNNVHDNMTAAERSGSQNAARYYCHLFDNMACQLDGMVFVLEQLGYKVTFSDDGAASIEEV